MPCIRYCRVKGIFGEICESDNSLMTNSWGENGLGYILPREYIMRLQAICLKNGNTTIFIAFFIVGQTSGNGNKRRKKQRFEGEIRFILALKYYRMARHFGDIPLIKEKPVSLEEAALPRSPKQEVLDYAIENVDKAIEYLPETYSGDDVGRITKGAALMLKADMYLDMAKL